MCINMRTKKQKGEKPMEFNNGIPAGLELDKGFNRIFDFIENTNECASITGKAGTGKSTLLQYVKAKTAKNVVVLAPTGIAALNVGGKTIHSFFGFPWNLIEKAKAYHKNENHLKAKESYKNSSEILSTLSKY